VANTQEDSQDVEMSGMDTEPTEELYSVSGRMGSSAHAQSSTSGFPNVSSDPIPAPAQKRRMVITHDKYMSMQSLVVFHLAEVERETGKGLDRDELIDWYLELKEETIQDLDELEYEKELFVKVLKKLVKVCSLNIFQAYFDANRDICEG
jgi:DNA replication licensing factor MCM6